jgi:hypothetical protein
LLSSHFSNDFRIGRRAVQRTRHFDDANHHWGVKIYALYAVVQMKIRREVQKLVSFCYVFPSRVELVQVLSFSLHPLQHVTTMHYKSNCLSSDRNATIN